MLWWFNRIIQREHVFDRSAKNNHIKDMHNIDSVAIQYGRTRYSREIQLRANFSARYYKLYHDQYVP